MRAALLSALILAGCSVRELVPDAEPVNGEAGPIADTSAADTSEDQLAPVDVVEPVDAGADAAALDAVELDASAWDAGDVVSVDTKPDASVVDVVDVVDVAQAPDVPSTPCFAPDRQRPRALLWTMVPSGSILIGRDGVSPRRKELRRP